MSPSEAQLDKRARAEGHHSWSAWKRALEDETGVRICGEPTLKEPMRPCSRPLGWGTQGEAEGPCIDHQDDAEAKRQAVKRDYLKLVAAGNYTLDDCANAAGVARRTLDRWAKADSQFAKLRRRAEVKRARRRLENLSDSMYQDALAGKTKGNERIYLMKVYAASLRRRGADPSLDWDQPDAIRVSYDAEISSPREELERKLDAIRERMADSESAEEGWNEIEHRSNGK